MSMTRLSQEPLHTLLHRLTDLVAIPSQTGHEEGVSRYIRDCVVRSGADVEVDADQNVAAVFSPSDYKATLHVAGHMDTVPPGAGWTVDPLSPIVQDDRLIGLGSSDMKAGLSGMLACIDSLSRNRSKHLRTIFGFTICEEGPFPGKRNGVHNLCERYGGEYAITAEASGAGNGMHFPSVGSQAHFRAAVTFGGRTSHSAYPEKGVNAIAPAAEFVRHIQEYNDALEGRWRSLWLENPDVMARPCAAVTMISGGVAVNVIPDRCTVQVSRRTAPGETFEQVSQELRDLLQGLGETQVEFGQWEDPCLTPADSPLIAAGRKAIEESGRTFQPRLSRGRQDLVIFAKHGMHAYNIGAGSAGSGHCPDEYCMFVDLLSGTQLLEATIRNLDEALS
jgi:acetylornithine deacetylase/succinyl-diaminopimelate desuccinylase-like protein